MTEDSDLGSTEGDCGVGAVADDLRALFLRPPREPVAEAHLRTILRAADEVHGNGRGVIDLDARRRAGRKALGVAIGGAILLTGGLAAAGELPAALQQRVSSLVAPVGVHLPEGRGVADPRGPSIDPTVSLPPLDDHRGDRVPPTPPGQAGVAPGESHDAPGNGGIDPGRSGVAPAGAGGGGSETPHGGAPSTSGSGKATNEDGKDKTTKSESPATSAVTTSTTTVAAGGENASTAGRDDV